MKFEFTLNVRVPVLEELLRPLVNALVEWANNEVTLSREPPDGGFLTEEDERAMNESDRPTTKPTGTVLAENQKIVTPPRPDDSNVYPFPCRVPSAEYPDNEKSTPPTDGCS